MSLSFKTVSALAAWWLACGLAGSCGGGPKRAPAIGEAYVGPHSLKIRADIPTQSGVVATARHGDRLEIVQRRRRFLKVRTAGGAEGWADDRQLLAASDMAALRELSRQAGEMPAQGQATTFGDLNVHTQPSRPSPSFVQIKEGEKVDVLLHRLFPRTVTPRAPLIRPAPKKPKAAKKPAKEPQHPPPPMPKPPPPPPDWQEMSRSVRDPAEESGQAEERPPEPMDRWSLVRLAGGASGWVLTGRLVMAIPDEVAQYAEGKRIVSYFPLGEVEDRGEKRRNWLWTTAGESRDPHDFDSFRVFVWSLRRRRYETAYIERNVKGYAPVQLREVELSGGRSGAGGRYPGFSICMEKKDGQRVRREFAFTGTVVRSAGERPCEPGSGPLPGPAAMPGAVAESKPAAAPEEPLLQRWTRGIRSAVGRLFER